MRKTAIVLALLVVVGVVGAMLPAQESSRRRAQPNAEVEDGNSTASESLADRLESAGDDDLEMDLDQPAIGSSQQPQQNQEPKRVQLGGGNTSQAPRELSVLAPANDPNSTTTTVSEGTDDRGGSFQVTEQNDATGTSVLRQPATQQPQVQQPATQPRQPEPRTFRADASLQDEPQVVGSESNAGRTSSRRRRTIESAAPSQSAAPKQSTGTSRRLSSRVAQVPQARQARSAKTQVLQSWGPALRVEATGPREIIIGKEATYVINVINSGKVSAKDFFLRVSLPTWVQLVTNSATTGSAEIKDDAVGAARLVWSVPQVAAGRNEQLKLRFVARENRPVKLSIDWVLKPIVTTAEIKVQKPQLRLNLTGPSDILLGTSETFTLVVSNPGTGPADNVVLSIATVGDAKTSRNLGTIPAGGQRKLEFDLTANDPGRMSVRAEVVGDGGLKDDLTENIQVRSPKLKLRIGGPKLKFAGTKASYEIRVINAGNATADKVVAQIKLPTGAKYLSGLSGAKVVAGGIRWNVGRMETGGERVFRFDAQLLLAGENRLDVAAVSGRQTRVRGSFVTKVEALADLKLAVNDPQGPQAVGKDVVYELHLTNRGTKAAENIDITVQFSKGIEPIRATGAKADVIPGQVLFKQIPRLGPGRKITLKIVARASKKGNHRFRAQVECKDPETRLASEDTTRFFGEEKQTLQATRPSDSKNR